MPKVKVKKVYFDKVRDEYPEVGKEFDVEEKRAEILVNAGVCEIVKDKADEGPAKPEPKKVTKKASKKDETK